MAEIGSQRSGYDVNFASKIVKLGDDDLILLRFLVPGIAGSLVIGKGGENVKRLEKDYMVKINGLENHANTNVIVLQGKKKDCFGCLSELMKTCKSGPYAADNLRTLNHEMNLLVNRDCIAAIMGRGGCQLKSICRESKSHIKVDPSTLPNSNERVIAIGGDTEENVTIALQLILDVIMNHPVQSPTFYYTPGSYKSDESEDGQVQMSVGAAMRQIKGMQNQMAGYNMMQNNQMQNPQVQNRMQTSQMQSQKQNQQTQNQVQNNMIQNQDAQTSPSFADILIKDRDDYVGPKFSKDGYPLDFQQVQTKTELILPNDVASSIIGMKGTNIKYVCELSGVKVNDKLSNNGDRTLIIMGTQEQVQIAQQLMLNCARSCSKSVTL